MKISIKNLNANVKVIGIGVLLAFVISCILLATASWLIFSGRMLLTIGKYIMPFVYFLSLTIMGIIMRFGYRGLESMTILYVNIVYLLVILIVNLLIYSKGVYNIVYALIGVTVAYPVTLLQNRQHKRGKGYRKKMRIR